MIMRALPIFLVMNYENILVLHSSEYGHSSIQPPTVMICSLQNSKEAVWFREKNLHKLLTCCYMHNLQLKLNFHPTLFA
jgi:hypothetical protein